MKNKAKKEKAKVKFISYDGKWPCLCNGTLVIEVNGKIYELKNVLISGGNVFCNEEEEGATKGKWSIDDTFLPRKLKPYAKEITGEVNCNVPWGCCGGCI